MPQWLDGYFLQYGMQECPVFDFCSTHSGPFATSQLYESALNMEVKNELPKSSFI